MTLHEKARLAEQAFLEALFEEYGEVEGKRYAHISTYPVQLQDKAQRFYDAAKEWVFSLPASETGDVNCPKQQ